MVEEPDEEKQRELQLIRARDFEWPIIEVKT